MTGGRGSSERIAAALRGRIETGELVAGQRVPSVRAIAGEWGVAVATASRVLAALRAEGLVRVVPGVGTVVAAGAVVRGGAGAGVRAGVASPAGPVSGGAVPTVAVPVGAAPGHPVGGGRVSGDAVGSALLRGRARPVRREDALSRERIVAVAVAVADVEGLAAVSMRRIAGELGVVAMALYRHLGDKDELLLRMLDVAMRRWRPPAADLPEPEQLREAVRGLWATFRRHPWLAQALSVTRPQAVPAGMAYSEWVLGHLTARGLAVGEAFDVHLAVINYARGTGMALEPEREAEASTGMDNEEWLDAHGGELAAVLGSGEYPNLERMVGQTYDLDVDELFERGLGLLLAGLEARLSTT